MRAGVGNFRLQRPMPPFQFRKVGFYGHVGGFSSARSLPDWGSLHLLEPFSKGLWLCSAATPNSRDNRAPRGGRGGKQKAKRTPFWGSAVTAEKKQPRVGRGA